MVKSSGGQRNINVETYYWDISILLWFSLVMIVNISSFAINSDYRSMVDVGLAVGVDSGIEWWHWKGFQYIGLSRAAAESVSDGRQGWLTDDVECGGKWSHECIAALELEVEIPFATNTLWNCNFVFQSNSCQRRPCLVHHSCVPSASPSMHTKTLI